MREAGLTFDRVCTSYLSRATETLDIVQKEMGAGHVPTSRSWRLNERHYGALQVRGTARVASGDAAAHDSAPRAPQGLNKQETLEKHGAEQVVQWRRSYDVPPPPLDRSDPSHPSFDPLYREVDSSLLPSGESLELTAQRVLPEWNAVLAPAIREGQAPPGGGARQLASRPRHALGSHSEAGHCAVEHSDGCAPHQRRAPARADAGLTRGRQAYPWCTRWRKGLWSPKRTRRRCPPCRGGTSETGRTWSGG